MILNISGRTDIVAFYTNWFLNRYQEGFVDVRNPFYPIQVSRIYFEDVDAMIFCTKNPIPMLGNLAVLKHPFLFHVTLTPYKHDIEPNVPDKKEIIDAIKQLSSMIGQEKVFIRYDPVLINQQYPIEYHIKAFDKMCELLDGYTKTIIVSWIDMYQNVKKNMNVLQLRQFRAEDYRKIGICFSESAKKHHMTVQTCFEEINLCEYGFIKKDCLDKDLACELTGKTHFKKWQARRENKCSCVEMVDIGAYNTCQHFCKYCYANFDEKKVAQNSLLHDEHSSLLVGNIQETDIIKVRKK